MAAGNELTDAKELIAFRLEANRYTYAAFSNEAPSTRLDSHDYRYEKILVFSQDYRGHFTVPGHGRDVLS